MHPLQRIECVSVKVTLKLILLNKYQFQRKGISKSWSLLWFVQTFPRGRINQQRKKKMKRNEIGQTLDTLQILFNIPVLCEYSQKTPTLGTIIPSGKLLLTCWHFNTSVALVRLIRSWFVFAHCNILRYLQRNLSK